MKRIFLVSAVMSALVLMSVSAADGFSATVDFSANALQIANKKVTSFDAGNFTDSEIVFSYEAESFGGTIAIGFQDFDKGEIKTGNPGAGNIAEVLEFDEVSAWVKLGSHVKVTAGVFTRRGVNPLNSDIDDYALGIFATPVAFIGRTDDTIVGEADRFDNGLMPELIFGNLTLQAFVGANLILPTKRITLPTQPVSDDIRTYSYGARIGYAIEDIANITAVYRIDVNPTYSFGNTRNSNATALDLSDLFMTDDTYVSYLDGRIQNRDLTANSFGIFGEITAVENLGIVVGYSGWLPAAGADDLPLFSGIDLRATYTGIDRLSLSTQHNVSFGKTPKFIYVLPIMGTPDQEKKTEYFSLYNALAATFGLTEKLDLTAKVSNVYSTTTDKPTDGDSLKLYSESLTGEVKLVTKVNEHASMSVGLGYNWNEIQSVDTTTEKKVLDTTHTFYIPVLITVKW